MKMGLGYLFLRFKQLLKLVDLFIKIIEIKEKINAKKKFLIKSTIYKKKKLVHLY